MFIKILSDLLHNINIIQFGIFSVLLITLWLVENSYSNVTAEIKWRHTKLNSFFTLTAVPIQFISISLCVLLAMWCENEHWGLFYLLQSSVGTFLNYVLMFFFLDFFDYIYHRTMHSVPILWRFHLIHHTDMSVDVSTTIREHPGDTSIRNIFLIIGIFMSGASVEVLLFRQAVETLSNVCAHTQLRVPTFLNKMITFLFVTPNFHKSHHHFKLPYTNKNYGDVLTIWDRIFGTYSYLKYESIKVGLDTHISGEGDDKIKQWASYLGPLGMIFKS